MKQQQQQQPDTKLTYRIFFAYPFLILHSFSPDFNN